MNINGLAFHMGEHIDIDSYRFNYITAALDTLDTEGYVVTLRMADSEYEMSLAPDCEKGVFCYEISFPPFSMKQGDCQLLICAKRADESNSCFYAECEATVKPFNFYEFSETTRFPSSRAKKVARISKLCYAFMSYRIGSTVFYELAKNIMGFSETKEHFKHYISRLEEVTRARRQKRLSATYLHGEALANLPGFLMAAASSSDGACLLLDCYNTPFYIRSIKSSLKKGDVCSFLITTRKDHVSTAVSYIIASRTNKWWSGGVSYATFDIKDYSFSAISFELRRIHYYFHKIDKFLAERSISPTLLYYEDFVADMGGEVSRVLKEALDIEINPADVPPPMWHKKQANDVNEYMINRYKEEAAYTFPPLEFWS